MYRQFSPRLFNVIRYIDDQFANLSLSWKFKVKADRFTLSIEGICFEVALQLSQNRFYHLCHALGIPVLIGIYK